jgi:hypothetical protein
VAPLIKGCHNKKATLSGFFIKIKTLSIGP